MAQPARGPHAVPVSIKGVIVRDGRVLLLKNERDEWELPGGRIEPGETPEECLAREIAEGPAGPLPPGRSWTAGCTASRSSRRTSSSSPTAVTRPAMQRR